MMIHELKSKYNLDWDTFFGIITNNIEISYAIVDNPEYFTEFSSLWNSIDLDVWKDYIKLKVLLDLENIPIMLFRMSVFKLDYGTMICPV